MRNLDNIVREPQTERNWRACDPLFPLSPTLPGPPLRYCSLPLEGFTKCKMVLLVIWRNRALYTNSSVSQTPRSDFWNDKCGSLDRFPSHSPAESSFVDTSGGSISNHRLSAYSLDTSFTKQHHFTNHNSHSFKSLAAANVTRKQPRSIRSRYFRSLNSRPRISLPNVQRCISIHFSAHLPAIDD